MLVALAIAAMGKEKEPRNNVRFFVKAVRDDMYWLYIKDKKGNISFIGLDEDFNNLWGLNPDDFFKFLSFHNYLLFIVFK